VQPAANYPNVDEISRTPAEMWPGSPSTYKPATDVREMTLELRTQYRHAPSYWAIWSPTQVYFEEEYGIASLAESKELERALVRSGYWKPVLTSGDTVLFRLDVGRAPSGLAQKVHTAT
jgi:hypothetical protein